MIDSVLNLLFRCSHKRIGRPITPVGKGGAPQGGTYVVCLDCGKQFAYDLKKMHIGKTLPRPEGPKPRTSRLKMALVATAVPVGWLLGLVWRSSKKGASKNMPDTRR